MERQSETRLEEVFNRAEEVVYDSSVVGECHGEKMMCTMEGKRKVAARAGVETTFKCDTCKHTFHRRQDISQHRCVATGSKGRVMTRPLSS